VLAFVRGDDEGPRVLVAAPVNGRLAVDADELDLPEGEWRPLWPGSLPVQVWVRDS
jgi:hypothetical protein